MDAIDLRLDRPAAGERPLVVRRTGPAGRALRAGRARAGRQAGGRRRRSAAYRAEVEHEAIGLGRDRADRHRRGLRRGHRRRAGGGPGHARDRVLLLHGRRGVVPAQRPGRHDRRAGAADRADQPHPRGGLHPHGHRAVDQVGEPARSPAWASARLHGTAGPVRRRRARVGARGDRLGRGRRQPLAPTPTCCRSRCPRPWGIDLYLKDESSHPTGSLKHRLARSLFLYALCNGWIGPAHHGRRGVLRLDRGLRGVLRPDARPAVHRGDAGRAPRRRRSR